MPITLPTSPSPEKAIPRLVVKTVQLTPILSSEDLELLRPGAKFAYEFYISPASMTYEQAAVWSSRLRKAKLTGDTVRIGVPQPGMNVSAASNFLVNASGQTGSNLNLKSGTVGDVVKEGQMFSLITGTRSYLYQFTEQKTVPAGGLLTMGVLPPLRAAHLNNDALNLRTPIIEGYVDFRALEIDVQSFYEAGIAFTVTER